MWIRCIRWLSLMPPRLLLVSDQTSCPKGNFWRIHRPLWSKLPGAGKAQCFITPGGKLSSWLDSTMQSSSCTGDLILKSISTVLFRWEISASEEAETKFHNLVETWNTEVNFVISYIIVSHIIVCHQVKMAAKDLTFLLGFYVSMVAKRWWDQAGIHHHHQYHHHHYHH